MDKCVVGTRKIQSIQTSLISFQRRLFRHTILEIPCCIRRLDLFHPLKVKLKRGKPVTDLIGGIRLLLGEIVNEFKLDQEVQASGFTVEEESLLLEVGEGGEGEV